MAPITAHVDAATGQPHLAWHTDPSVLLGLVLLAGVYLAALWRLRPADEPSLPRWRIVSFFLALLSILVALSAPLDELSDGYLFSAHMLQHLLLIMFMPTLLLLGIAPWMVPPVLRVRPLASLVRVLTLAPFTYFAFNIVFAGSHVPAFYDLTLRDHGIHIAEHLVFMAVAVLAWSPVLSPAPELRLPAPAQVLYLFLNTFPALLVGAIITDANSPIYPTYAAAPRVWGLSVMGDQQIGGLMMWIGGSLYYLVVLTVVFFRWALAEEAKEPRPI